MHGNRRAGTTIRDGNQSQHYRETIYKFPQKQNEIIFKFA